MKWDVIQAEFDDTRAAEPYARLRDCPGCGKQTRTTSGYCMDCQPTLLEADLQAAIIETARTFGWRVAHFRPARTKHGWKTAVAADGKGFPDLVLVRGDRLIFAELKSDRGKPSPDQEAWLAGLELVAQACDLVEVHLWTPADWPERIVEILTRREVSSVHADS